MLRRHVVAAGSSSDVSHWFASQLEIYAELVADGLIDVTLDGTRPIADLTDELVRLSHR